MINSRLIPVLQMLSNQAHQEKVWMSKQAPGYDCYPESLEVFYETWDLFNRDPAKSQLTHREFQLLRELHLLIQNFDRTTIGQDPVKILKDPRWALIRQKAKSLSTLLKGKKGGVKMSNPQEDDLHEFISYYVSLIKDKTKLQYIWGQYSADSWLEELVDFWEEYKRANPRTVNQYESLDKLVAAIDALLDDIEIETEANSNSLIQFIFSHPKWREIELHARMIHDVAVEG